MINRLNNDFEHISLRFTKNQSEILKLLKKYSEAKLL